MLGLHLFYVIKKRSLCVEIKFNITQLILLLLNQSILQSQESDIASFTLYEVVVSPRDAREMRHFRRMS
jgi:hypothetical protein